MALNMRMPRSHSPIRLLTEGFATLRINPSPNLEMLRQEMRHRQNARNQRFRALSLRSTKSLQLGNSGR